MTPTLSPEPGPVPVGGPPPGVGVEAGIRQPLSGFSPPGVLIGAILAAVTIALYAQTFFYGFVDLDDAQYVVENGHVNTGVSIGNVLWSLRHAHAANWHPLTWMSHMLDCDLFGLSAGGHHATSVLLHAATTVVLFLALRRLSGQLWPSAFVAAAFALHPLRVESVAWVAERKDVLSGLFFAFTLLAYARYAQTPRVGRYLLVAVTLSLGLMAKPMLVTVPCLLLVLDVWPLRRFGVSSTRWLVAEKLPLLALAAGSAAATVWAQSEGGAVVDLGHLSFAIRLQNAVVSYVVYLEQTLVPTDLAVYYPYPKGPLPTGEVFGAVAVLVALTVGAVAWRRRRPAVLVGWLWYLGMLVPVIGIVQVGSQAHADRYTYLPQIGLWVALAWGVPWERVGRRVVAVGALVVLLSWAGLSAHQLGYWRNSETLYTHSLACTGPNVSMLLALGQHLAAQKRWDEAVARLRQVLEIRSVEQAHYSLALALVHLNRDGEAAEHFQRAYEMNPSRTEARKNLVIAHTTEGTRLARKRQVREALSHFDTALAIDPACAEARRNKAILLLNLGITAAGAGQPGDAIAAFGDAIRTDPKLGVAHSYLGVVLLEVGDIGGAVDAFRAALRIDPNDTRARTHLEAISKTPP